MRRPVSTLSSLALVWLLSVPAGAEAPAATPASKEETAMTHTARGTFEVRLTPLAPAEGEADIGAGRMAIDKTFRGDLEGTSQGQMLAVRTAVQDSAGYVAMERVQGELQGRRGSFVFQHSSTMDRGEPRQSVTVLPDSGTGGLEGLSGSMIIEIEEGEHRYSFEYSLPRPPASEGTPD